MAKLSELLGNLIGGQTASPMTEEERAMAAAGQNPALDRTEEAPMANRNQEPSFLLQSLERADKFGQPVAGTTPQFAGEPIAAQQARVAQMTSQPVPSTQGVPIMLNPNIPAAGSPQANFERRMAEGEELTQPEIAQAQQYAQSIGTTFDPVSGYSREPFLQSQEPQLTPPAQGGGLTTQSGIPLSQFLSGEAIPEAGLREEGQLTGRGETLSPDAWAQLSAEREQRALENFGVSGGPDSRGLSERDASGLTQGQRRNLERAAGVTGSAQVDAARAAGERVNQEAAQIAEANAMQQQKLADARDAANQPTATPYEKRKATLELALADKTINEETYKDLLVREVRGDPPVGFDTWAQYEASTGIDVDGDGKVAKDPETEENADPLGLNL